MIVASIEAGANCPYCRRVFHIKLEKIKDGVLITTSKLMSRRWWGGWR